MPKKSPDVYVVDLDPRHMHIENGKLLITINSAGGKRIYYIRTTLREVLAKCEPRAVRL